MLHARVIPFPRRRTTAARCTRRALPLLALATLCACSSGPKAAAPGAKGQPDGLEAVWWIVDDSNHDRIAFENLGEALLQYQDRPTGLSPAALRLWRSNGLRVVAVPAKELDLLHDRVRTMGQAIEQWFGVLPTWTPLVTGPAFEQPWTLALDNGPIELPPGNVRLLGRAWMVPVEPSLSLDPPRPGHDEQSPAMAAAMNVELLPQHTEARDRHGSFAQNYGRDPRPSIENSGVNFPRLTLHFACRGGDAIVIVPEDPFVEWKKLPPGQPRELFFPSPQGPTVIEPPTSLGPPVAPATKPPLDQPFVAPTQQPVVQLADQISGPAPVRLPTLGEAMLCDLNGVGLSRRVVLILIPRVPEKYQLIVR